MANLYLIRVGEKHGYMDENGRLAIEPTFVWAGDFSEGFAFVGHPDPAGRKDRITGVVQNLWGYIDAKEKPITPVHFQGARPFSEGLAGVYLGKKFGYINARGEYAIEPQYDAGSEFSERLATVTIGKMHRVIDTEGNTQFEVAATHLGACQEGLMFCEIKRKWSYVDRTGNTVLELTCSAAGGFREGLAEVLVKGKIGYIDKRGEFVIPPRFGQAKPFSEGLAFVEFIPKGKRDWSTPQEFGYIDKQGRQAFAGTFRFGDGFCEGLAAVNPTSLKSASYIDTAGQVVIGDIRCDYAGPFTGGLARINTKPGGEEMGYINRRGEYVWEPQG